MDINLNIKVKVKTTLPDMEGVKETIVDSLIDHLGLNDAKFEEHIWQAVCDDIFGEPANGLDIETSFDIDY